jgi:FkbM family methyltransferase
MSASSPSGGSESFRRKTVAERIASALPSGGAIGRVRQRLKPLFEQWLSAGGQTLDAKLPGGELVRIAPAFRHVTWNPDEYEAFRAAVSPGDVVIDAGANVGAYTVVFAQWVGPEGHVYAFEPDPAAAEGLRRHVELNAVSRQVTIVPAAVSDGREARLRLSIGASSGISRVVADDGRSGAAGLEVEAASLDQFCAERGVKPNVIKIDVEGAELAALRGARRTIAAAGPSLALFVEFHPQLWPALGYSADEVRSECETLGLTVEPLDGISADVWRTEGICMRLRPRRP